MFVMGISVAKLRDNICSGASLLRSCNNSLTAAFLELDKATRS